MNYQLRITPHAHEDIRRNADWWADHHSIDKALEWTRAVYSQLQTLTTFPLSCSLSLESDDLPLETREKLVGLGSRPRFRAVFIIQGEEVIVVAIRAAQQDALTADDLTLE